MLIKDVTGGVTLTRVTGVPGVNQYRVAPDDSKTPHVIELNSGQAGNTIGYDFYSFGSIADAENFNSPEVTGTITSLGEIIGESISLTDTNNVYANDTGTTVKSLTVNGVGIGTTNFTIYKPIMCYLSCYNTAAGGAGFSTVYELNLKQRGSYINYETKTVATGLGGTSVYKDNIICNPGLYQLSINNSGNYTSTIELIAVGYRDLNGNLSS